MDDNFNFRVVCEGYGFATYASPENIIEQGSDFIKLKISYKELESIIETLQELKSVIDYNKKDNE